MSQAICVRCGGEVDGTAYVDTRCTDRARAQLAEIADMVGAARDIATGQARHSGSGGGSGKPGSRLPLDLAATAKLDGVTAALGSWLRLVVAERGTDTADVSHWGDPIEGIAVKLGNHMEWLRHQRFADEFLTDVEAAARVVRGLARGRAEQRYLGPCGALWWHSRACHAMPDAHVLRCECWCHDGIAEMRPCDGDVYAIVHSDGTTARTGRCKTCEAEVETSERRVWLDAEVRQYAYRAAQIADAYGLSDDTIRSWASRGKLPSYWVTDAGLTVPWTDPEIGPDLKGAERAAREAEVAIELKARGPRVHYVGDVLDLAAAAAAWRESERAKRARRAAAKAAESEEAA